MRIRLASGFFILLAALLTACGPSLSGSGGGTSASSPPADGGGGGGGNSGTAALTWDGPNTNADSSGLTDLAGYRVYRSTTPGSNYTLAGTVTGVPATGGGSGIQHTATGLASGTHYFVVRAYDTSGNESANALPGEVSKTIP